MKNGIMTDGTRLHFDGLITLPLRDSIVQITLSMLECSLNEHSTLGMPFPME